MAKLAPRHRIINLALQLYAALCGICLAEPSRAQPHFGGTLTVGLSYDLDTLNVYATGFLGDVEACVVEGLVAPDEHAHYEPVLATNVPTIANGGIVLRPDGGMTVTYHLRPGVRWQDGAPFNAADVKFTWEAVSDPAFLAESKDGSEDVQSIDTPDPLTAIVNYRRPSAAFASTLFTFGILPRHLLQGHDLNHDPYNEKPIGTGPFMVRSFHRGDYVVLDRNPHYWRHAADGAQLPYIHQITFRIVPNSNTMGVLIRAGEIDFAPLISTMLAKEVTGTPSIEIVKGPSLGWDHLDFNLRGPPALRDPKVRQAIAYGINRMTLVRAAGSYPVPINSVVVPVLSGLRDRNLQSNPYDPARANRILDQAGYVRGRDGVRAKETERLAFGITAESGRTDDEIAEQILIAQFAVIGIRLAADNKSGVSFREARYHGRYDLLYGRWVTAADPVYSVFYGTHGPNNGQGYSDPACDGAMLRMETAMQPGARREAAYEMQRILARDLPTIPLLSSVSLAAVTDRLHNVRLNPTNMTDFIGVADWYLEPPSPAAASAHP